MHTSTTFAIFWLPSSARYEPVTGGNDSRFESLVIRFLNDVGGNSYYNILNQYPDSTNGTPLDSSVFGGSYVDTTSYPAIGTPSRPLSDLNIQAEVTRVLTIAGWSPGPDKIFLVFTGYGINSCLNSSFCTFPTFTSPGYCAYHSYFSLNSQPTIYGNMPDFGGVGGPCTPHEPSPNNDLYADPEINLVSHELFEAVSDPQLNAWYDLTSGTEIGDLCAWKFGSTVGVDGTNIILNGHDYLVQQEWSNFNNSCVLSYGPSKLIGLTLTPSLGASRITSTNPFNITYSSKGTLWWTTNSANTSRIYVDQLTQINLSGTSLGSNGLERWCFVENCSDLSISIDNGTSATYRYYDMLSQAVSDSIIDGGSPSLTASVIVAPVIPSGVDQPQFASISLSSIPETVWVLRGTEFNVTTPINGVLGERWLTTTASWIINNAFVIPTPITYYHQYLTTFSDQIVGGGAGFSPPLVTFSFLGQSLPATLSENVWADATGYQYSAQLSGSSSNERWVTLSPAGSVSSPSIVSPIYYHQYNVSVVYSVSGGGAPQPPIFTSTQYGLSVSLSAELQPSTMWLDGGSQFAIVNPLVGSTLVERWQTPTATVQSIQAASSFSFAYYHQYYLQADGGSTEPVGSGWYDSGSQIPLLLDYVWNMSQHGLIRQNLLSYTLDGQSSQVSRQGSGFVVLPTINMTEPHSIIVDSTVQYYITVSGAMLLGSQTDDGWFDAGSEFTIQADNSATFIATSPVYVYALDSGFQIISTTPLYSVSWSSPDGSLSFQSTGSNVTILVPAVLRISPAYVHAGGSSLHYAYSSGTRLLTFESSSNPVVVHFESITSSSFVPPGPTWLLYTIIGFIVGGAVISGMVVLKLRERRRRARSKIVSP